MIDNFIDTRYRDEQFQDFIGRIYPYKKKNTQDFQVANLTFQVTDACNLRCSYCYQINKNNHVMPFEVAQKFIDMILEPDGDTIQYINSYAKKAVMIDFIGGETLLQIKLIEKICDYFIQKLIALDHPWQYNFMFSLGTNGVLYFNENVQHFLKRFSSHVSLSITVDGNKELHDKCRKFPDGSGSYDMALAAVKHYRKFYHGNPGCKLTIAPANVMYINDAIQNLFNEGYEHINLNCVYEEGWTYEHAKILYNQLKQVTNYVIENGYSDKYISMFKHDNFCPIPIEETTNWCGGNGRMIAVDYKGDIFPCLRYMESSLGDTVPPYIIGNVNDGIMVKKEDKERAKKCQQVNRITQSSRECIECPIAQGCSYCQAYNYQSSGGNINHRATYICPMHKATSLANVYYWNIYFRLNNLPYRFKMWLQKEEALKIIDEEEYILLLKLSLPFD